MQRSGLNGTLDPIIQVLTNLKYITDLQSLFDGGGFSWLTRNANDVLQGAYHLGSGDTNASLFRATRGAFNLVGLPLVTYGLNTVGGINPVMRTIAGAALQYGTSSENVTHMTEAATGFKGVKPADANEGKLQDLEGLQGLQGLQELGAAPKETAGEGAGLGGGNVPWAVMDDFAGYAAKILPPVWRAIPGPVKAVAAVGAAAGTAASVWQAGEKYRGQPRPEKPAR